MSSHSIKRQLDANLVPRVGKRRDPGNEVGYTRAALSCVTVSLLGCFHSFFFFFFFGGGGGG